MAHGVVPRRSSPASRDCNDTISFPWTLDTRNTSSANQTPRVNLDRRRYGSATQIPGTTHGTVDHGGSICGLQKKSEGSARVQTRSTNPNLTAVRAQSNMSLLLGKSVGADEVFGISQTFCNEVRSAVQLPSQERRE
jgi:hypothetical protein